MSTTSTSTTSSSRSSQPLPSPEYKSSLPRFSRALSPDPRLGAESPSKSRESLSRPPLLARLPRSHSKEISSTLKDRYRMGEVAHKPPPLNLRSPPPRPAQPPEDAELTALSQMHYNVSQREASKFSTEDKSNDGHIEAITTDESYIPQRHAGRARASVTRHPYRKLFSQASSIAESSPTSPNSASHGLAINLQGRPTYLPPTPVTATSVQTPITPSTPHILSEKQTRELILKRIGKIVPFNGMPGVDLSAIQGITDSDERDSPETNDNQVSDILAAYGSNSPMLSAPAGTNSPSSSQQAVTPSSKDKKVGEDRSERRHTHPTRIRKKSFSGGFFGRRKQESSEVKISSPVAVEGKSTGHITPGRKQDGKEEAKEVEKAETKSDSSARPVFGSRLALQPDAAFCLSLVGGQAQILPIIVFSTIEELFKRGLGVPGLFRLQGDNSGVADLVSLYETPPKYGDGLALGGLPRHDIATVLKRYLSSLPEPILDTRLWPLFTQACVGDLSSPKHMTSRIAAARLLFRLQPKRSFGLLLYIIAFLIQIPNYSQNDLSIRNLAIMFGPAILAPRDGSIRGLGETYNSSFSSMQATNQEGTNLIRQSQDALDWLLRNWYSICPDLIRPLSEVVADLQRLESIDLGETPVLRKTDLSKTAAEEIGASGAPVQPSSGKLEQARKSSFGLDPMLIPAAAGTSLLVRNAILQRQSASAQSTGAVKDKAEKNASYTTQSSSADSYRDSAFPPQSGQRASQDTLPTSIEEESPSVHDEDKPDASDSNEERDVWFNPRPTSLDTFGQKRISDHPPSTIVADGSQHGESDTIQNLRAEVDMLLKRIAGQENELQSLKSSLRDAQQDQLDEIERWKREAKESQADADHFKRQLEDARQDKLASEQKLVAIHRALGLTNLPATE